jgi:putative oxidoreductase
MNALNRWSPQVYCLMRFIVAGLFSFHGAQKLFGAFGGHKVHDAKMLTAGAIEFGGGLLVAFGLITTIAAFICAAEMVVAYATVHAKMGLWPIENKGEPALVYLFIFLFIAFYGDGPISLGALFKRKR